MKRVLADGEAPRQFLLNGKQRAPRANLWLTPMNRRIGRAYLGTAFSALLLGRVFI
jgi:hypothetical protein